VIVDSETIDSMADVQGSNGNGAGGGDDPPHRLTREAKGKAVAQPKKLQHSHLDDLDSTIAVFAAALQAERGGTGAAFRIVDQSGSPASPERPPPLPLRRSTRTRTQPVSTPTPPASTARSGRKRTREEPQRQQQQPRRRQRQQEQPEQAEGTEGSGSGSGWSGSESESESEEQIVRLPSVGEILNGGSQLVWRYRFQDQHIWFPAQREAPDGYRFWNKLQRRFHRAYRRARTLHPHR